MKRYYNQFIQNLLIGKRNIWQLIDSSDLNLSDFVKIFKEKKINNLINHLKKSKKFDILKKIDELKCFYCQGTGYKINNFYNNVLKIYKKEVKNRPEALAIYDQGYIDPEGIIKRVEFIYERGDLLDSKILIIGDDDLISLAIGLTGLSKEVIVLEIDKRLVDFINEKAKKLNIKVKAYQYDVKDNLPKKFQKRFDIFITDPTETLNGIKVFLSRGIAGLKGKNSSGYFGLTTLEASLSKWFQIEKFLIDCGFVITDIKRQFNKYPGTTDEIEEKLPIRKIYDSKELIEWYKSSLLRIEAIKDPQNYYIGDIDINKELYQDKESLATPML